jgi:hypothetical protein
MTMTGKLIRMVATGGVTIPALFVAACGGGRRLET